MLLSSSCTSWKAGRIGTPATTCRSIQLAVATRIIPLFLLSCVSTITTTSSLVNAFLAAPPSSPSYRSQHFINNFNLIIVGSSTTIPIIITTTATTTTSSQLFARGRGSGGKSDNKKNNKSSETNNMPRGVKKEHLPSKVCVVCNRPFTWRKKWERCWDEVTTCSKSCNSKRRSQNKQQNSSNNDTGVDDAGSLRDKFIDHTDDEAIVFERIPPPPPPSQTKNVYGIENQEDWYESPSSPDTEPALAGVAVDVLQLEDVDLGDQTEDEKEDDSLALSSKAQRKAAKKEMKAQRRAQREGRNDGSVDPTAGQKQCDICAKSVNLLVRCQYDGSNYQWKMVCGKCWNHVSGGVPDGDDAHPLYRYGGLWKNRRRSAIPA